MEALQLQAHPPRCLFGPTQSHLMITTSKKKSMCMYISYKRKMIRPKLESSCEKKIESWAYPALWCVPFSVGRDTFLQYRVSVQAVSFEAPHCALEDVYIATRMATSAPGSANRALFWLTLQLVC